MPERSFIDQSTGEEEVVNIPDRYAADPRASEDWYNLVYKPYQDSGLQAARENPSHPFSVISDGAFARGLYGGAQFANALQVRLGLDNPVNAAKDIARYQSYINQLPHSENTLKFLQKVSEIYDEKGFWGALDEYVDAVATEEGGLTALWDVTKESLGMTAPVLGLAGAAALGGAGVATMIAIAGLGSGATEFGASTIEMMNEYLQKEGTDISDDKAVAQLFQNEEKMEEFTDFALKRGIPIGVVDALSMGVAGKAFAAITRSTKVGEQSLKGAKAAKKAAKTAGKKAPPVMATEAGALRKAAGLATEAIAIQPTLGGFGEYLGQKSAGQKINYGDIFTEAFAEIMPGAAETGIGIALNKRKSGKLKRLEAAVKEQQKNKQRSESHQEKYGITRKSATDAFKEVVRSRGNQPESLAVGAFLNNKDSGFENYSNIFIKNMLLDTNEPITEGTPAIAFGSDYITSYLQNIGIKDEASTGVVEATAEEKKLATRNKKGELVYTKAAENLANIITKPEERAEQYAIELNTPLATTFITEKNKKIGNTIFDSVESSSILDHDIKIAKNKDDKKYQIYIDDKLLSTETDKGAAFKAALLNVQDLPTDWGTSPEEDLKPTPTDLEKGKKYPFFTPDGKSVDLEVSNIAKDKITVINEDGKKEIVGDRLNTLSTNSRDSVLNTIEGKPIVGTLNTEELNKNAKYVTRKFEDSRRKKEKVSNDLIRDKHAIETERKRRAYKVHKDLEKARKVAPLAVAKEAAVEEAVVEETAAPSPLVSLPEDIEERIKSILPESVENDPNYKGLVEFIKIAQEQAIKTNNKLNEVMEQQKLINRVPTDPTDADKYNLLINATSEWKSLPSIFSPHFLVNEGFQVIPVTKEYLTKANLPIPEESTASGKYFIYKVPTRNIGMEGLWAYKAILLDEDFVSYLQDKGLDATKLTPKKLEIQYRNYQKTLQVIREGTTDIAPQDIDPKDEAYTPHNRKKDGEPPLVEMYLLSRSDITKDTKDKYLHTNNDFQSFVVDRLNKRGGIERFVGGMEGRTKELFPGEFITLLNKVQLSTLFSEYISVAQDYRNQEDVTVRDHYSKVGLYLQWLLVNKKEDGGIPVGNILDGTGVTLIENKDGVKVLPITLKGDPITNVSKPERGESNVPMSLRLQESLDVEDSLNVLIKTNEQKVSDADKSWDTKGKINKRFKDSLSSVTWATLNSLGMRAGLRPKEAWQLQLMDVENAIKLFDTEGIDGTQLFIPQFITKPGSERTIPLVTTTIMFLKKFLKDVRPAMIENIKQVAKKEKWTSEKLKNILEEAEQYLFPTLNGKRDSKTKGYHIDHSWMNNQTNIREYLEKRTRVKARRLTMYRYRSTYATLLHEGIPGRVAGMDIVSIAMLMGHRGNTQTTMKYIRDSQRQTVETRPTITELFEGRTYVEQPPAPLRPPLGGETPALFEGSPLTMNERLKKKAQQYSSVSQEEVINNEVTHEAGATVRTDQKKNINNARKNKRAVKPKILGKETTPEIRSQVSSLELNDILLLSPEDLEEFSLSEIDHIKNKLEKGIRHEQWQNLEDINAAINKERLYDPEGNGSGGYGGGGSPPYSDIPNFDKPIGDGPNEYNPNVIPQLFKLGDPLKWMKHMLGGDMLLNQTDRAQAELEWNERYPEGMTAAVMAKGIWAWGRGLGMPHRLGEKSPELRPAIILGDYIRRGREMTKSSLLSTPGVEELLSLSRDETIHVGQAHLILEELSRFNRPDGPPYLVVRDTAEGGAEIDVPDHVALEWETVQRNKETGEILGGATLIAAKKAGIEIEKVTKDYLDADNKTMEVYTNGMKDLRLFLNFLGEHNGAIIEPGQTIRLSPEEWNGVKTSRDVYRKGLFAHTAGAILNFVAGSPIMKSTLNEDGSLTEAPITEEDNLNTITDKLWDSILGYLKYQIADVENFRAPLTEAVKNKETYTQATLDEEGYIETENEVPIKNLDDFIVQLQAAEAKIAGYREANKTIPARVANELNQQLMEIAGQLNIIHGENSKILENKKSEFSPEQIESEQKRLKSINDTRNNIEALRAAYDAFSYVASNPWYISHQRFGKAVYSVKGKLSDGTMQTLISETDDFQLGDILKRQPEKERLQKRQNQVKRDMEKLGYTDIEVSQVKDQTIADIREFITDQDIPVLERLSRAFGHEDDPVIANFIDEIMNVAGAKGAGRFFMRRKKGTRGKRNGILGHATPDNIGNFAASQLTDYVRATSNSVPNNIFRKAKQSTVAELYDINPILGEYAEKHFKYLSTPEDYSGTIKSITFHATIGFNISSALVNASQTFIITAPLLKAIVGFGNSPMLVTRTLSKAFANAMSLSESPFKNLNTYGFNFAYDTMPESLKGTVTEEEWKVLKRQYSQGIIQSINNMEVGTNMRAQLAWIERNMPGEWGESFANVVKASAYMFGYIEQVNRITASLAAQRLVRSSPEMYEKFRVFTKDQTIYSTEEFSVDTAADMLVFKSQYLISKENRPQYFQNPVGNVMTQFMPYTINTLSLWAQALQMTFGRGAATKYMSPEQIAINKKSGNILLGSLMVGTLLVAGTMGMPWGENLKQIIKRASKAVNGYGFDLEDGMREVLADMGAGEAMIDMITRGPLSRLTGVDVSKRMVINEVVPYDLMAGDLTVAAGPTGAVFIDSIKRAIQAMSDFREGDRIKPATRFITSAMPIGFRNMIDATTSMWDPNEPIRTTTGRVILPNEKLNRAENLIRIIGFSPHTLRQERLRKQLISHLKMSASSKKEYYFRQLAKIGEKRRRTYEAGNMKGYREATKVQKNLIKEIGELNKEAIAEGRPEHLIKLNQRTQLNRLIGERFGVGSPQHARKIVGEAIRGKVTEEEMKRKGY